MRKGKSQEQAMNPVVSSLHHLVEKWLAPGPHGRVRVIRFGHSRSDGTRFVHVEASTRAGTRAIFFFRHDDGAWRVFPPRAKRPAMTAYRLAA
jgi:hypothetical protein